jgi:hypothetical protein
MHAASPNVAPNGLIGRQISPNRTKQNYLDLLGFIRPNPDVSMGYDDSKASESFLSQVLSQASQAFPVFSPGRPSRNARVRSGEQGEL